MHSVLSEPSAGFCDYFRSWRQYRKLSQLELALVAGVSQRHVSWLETGRSKPSRDMVLRLGEALDLPLRERNQFLNAAGFAPAYNESALDEPAMQGVYDAVARVLGHHDPMPAILVDRLWNVQMKNRGADLMFSLVGDAQDIWSSIGDDGAHNLALLTLHPKGLRRYISNWEEAIPEFVRRLKREAAASGDKKMQGLFEEIIALAGPLPAETNDKPFLMPVLPLEIQVGDVALSLFSVISTFGTPQDVTTQEFRIEAFYPSDKSTEQFFLDMSSN